MRADARRNLERVLQAAEEMFSSEGLAVPMDAIAARAGVGIGTVYRHFPTKEALFEAVVVNHLETLLDRCKQLGTCQEPGEAVFTFISELVELACQKQDLTDELAQAGIDKDAVGSVVKQHLEGEFSSLLRRAQAAGAVRTDVTPADVNTLLVGTCMAAKGRGDGPPSRLLVKVLCDGLRAGAPAPAAT